MPKVLWIGDHRPGRSPSQRFRIEQYIPYLEAHGWQGCYAYLLSESEDKLFYAPGHIPAKALLMLKKLYQRYQELREVNMYDLVFVQREAHFLGISYFERAYARRTKLLFDFDDAIWLPNVSENNRLFAWAKRPAKAKEVIRAAHLVFAGNAYLADFARQYNPQVVIMPTTVDTDWYAPMAVFKPPSVVTIGWSGSPTTIAHFQQIRPALKVLKQQYKERIQILVVGDSSYVDADLGIQGRPWCLEEEKQVLAGFDIGIMPLPDDEWSRGKCGLKGLLYMAMGVPAVMSPVGVNTEIIQDGENGFLAATIEEWVEKLSMLIEDPQLRQRLGQKGRQTVEERYSVRAWRDTYLYYFNKLPGF